MRLKDNSISPGDLSTQILLAIMVAEEVYAEEGAELVITSLNDGRHSKTSLHYSGNAVDLRVWQLPNHEATAKEIKNRLNVHYDVIAESTSSGNPSHIHIEYQPRRRDFAA